jgi:hypothetical protein
VTCGNTSGAIRLKRYKKFSKRTRNKGVNVMAMQETFVALENISVQFESKGTISKKQT